MITRRGDGSFSRILPWKIFWGTCYLLFIRNCCLDWFVNLLFSSNCYSWLIRQLGKIYVKLWKETVSLFLKQVSLKTHFERIFDPISRNKKNLIAQVRREGMFHKKFHFSITRYFEPKWEKPKKITVLLPYNKLKRVNLKTFFKNFKLEETEEIKVRWQDKLSRFPRKLLPPNLKSDDVNTEIEEFFNKTTNYICEISLLDLSR